MGHPHFFCTVHAMATTWYADANAVKSYSNSQSRRQHDGMSSAAYSITKSNLNDIFGYTRHLRADRNSVCRRGSTVSHVQGRDGYRSSTRTALGSDGRGIS
jgi:hypothetical protein